MASKNTNSKDMFTQTKTLLASSIGRMPTALVVILVMSLCVAMVAGVVVHFASQSRSAATDFMPLRLEVSSSATVPDIKRLRGNWVVQSPAYAMSLTLVDNRFEWIVRFADIADTQFYARGNFRIEGDVLVLGVRPDLGQPYDAQKPWVKYMPIAMKDLNAQISFDGDRMVWVIPSAEQGRILARTAAIFMGHEDGRFVWVRR